MFALTIIFFQETDHVSFSMERQKFLKKKAILPESGAGPITGVDWCRWGWQDSYLIGVCVRGKETIVWRKRVIVWVREKRVGRLVRRSH